VPKPAAALASPVPPRTVALAIGVLLVLIFSKYFYLTSLTSYYTFYLMTRFGVSVQSAQVYLFIFLFAVAAGTLAGGPIGDRIGRKRVIWGSILGVAPFTLAMPYVDLTWTVILSFVIGLIIASAFSAILVFAQELMPGKVGAVSGMFFGFAFGMGGIGAAVLGALADRHGIEFVYHLCAFLPLLGLLTVFLPDLRQHRPPAASRAAPPRPADARQGAPSSSGSGGAGARTDSTGTGATLARRSADERVLPVASSECGCAPMMTMSQPSDSISSSMPCTGSPPRWPPRAAGLRPAAAPRPAPPAPARCRSPSAAAGSGRAR
jgi:MFS family permease